MKAIGIIPLHKHLRGNRLAADAVQDWCWCLGWWRSLAASAVLAVAISILLLPLSGASHQTEEVAPIYSILYSFKALPDGEVPFAGLARDAAGNLYGTTVTGGGAQAGTVFKLDAAGKETVLHSFAGPPTDGAAPFAGVVRDEAGNLYGTTFNGGASSTCSAGLGCGVVFKLDAAGNETVLYNFIGPPTDGANPLGNLVRDTAGNLYGTTFSGGSSTNVCPGGCGVVFKLDAIGNETVLYSFTGKRGDGADPAGGLVQDEAGNLYGATTFGGESSRCGGLGCGVVFKLETSGKETVLHRFVGPPTDGTNPTAPLVRDAAGNLFGTTTTGGDSSNCPGAGTTGGCGVVFKLETSGEETVLHNFAGPPTDGSGSLVGLIRDAAGNLYGTTSNGGSIKGCEGFGCGVVFKLDKARKETVLHSFAGPRKHDGAIPDGVLIRDAAGNLYGTTANGGSSNACSGGCGVVFKLESR